MKRFTMVRRCVVAGCDGKPQPSIRSVHDFPSTTTDPALLQRWIKFVRVWRAGWTPSVRSTPSYLCSDHFTHDCFENYKAFTSGWYSNQYTKYTVLKQYEVSRNVKFGIWRHAKSSPWMFQAALINEYFKSDTNKYHKYAKEGCNYHTV